MGEGSQGPAPTAWAVDDETANWVQIVPAAGGANVLAELFALFPALGIHQDCPACQNGERPSTGCGCHACLECRPTRYRERLAHVIIHLNDDHTWTRERIAEWLESLDTDLEVGF